MLKVNAPSICSSSRTKLLRGFRSNRKKSSFRSPSNMCPRRWWSDSECMARNEPFISSRTRVTDRRCSFCASSASRSARRLLLRFCDLAVLGGPFAKLRNRGSALPRRDPCDLPAAGDSESRRPSQRPQASAQESQPGTWPHYLRVAWRDQTQPVASGHRTSTPRAQS